MSTRGFFSKLMKSSPEEKADMEIESKLEEERRKPAVNVLLLGIGGSGKSTVLKQFESLHGAKSEDSAAASSGSPFDQSPPQEDGSIATFSGAVSDIIVPPGSPDDRKTSFKASFAGLLPERVGMEEVKEMVRSNILEDICDLCTYNLKLQEDGDESIVIKDEKLLAEVTKMSKERFTLLEQPTISSKLATTIDEIWMSKEIQRTFKLRRRSFVMDNTPFFMSRVHDIARSSYTPSFDDYLRVRNRTIGVVVSNLSLVGHNGMDWKFRITDVGGQRSERRKWIDLFAGVDVVVWVVSLLGYDRCLFEDTTANDLDESLKLFEETCGNTLFAGTDFVIFLNKTDVLASKLRETPFTVYDPTFPKANARNKPAVIENIEMRFQSHWDKTTEILVKADASKSRNLFFHQTCATDVALMQKVLSDVQVSCLKKLLQDAFFA